MSQLSANQVSKKYHPETANATFGIVTAQWNPHITNSLKEGALAFLAQNGVPSNKVKQVEVSGAFEVPLASQYLAELADVDAVICIACLIKGETPHFHYIAEVVSQSLAQLALKFNKPFAFGVLTVNTEQEALDRAGGKFGNKGEEAAEAAFNLLSMKLHLLNK